jgi:hypothetical protein
MKMEVIKVEFEDGKVSSCLIKTDCNLEIWFDVWEDRTYEETAFEEVEITGDWNKYIFNLQNNDDLEIRKFQQDSNNFMECLELATESYYNHQLR